MFFIVFQMKSQQQLAFSFGETPQSLMLNPGGEVNYKYHYGIPVFSNVSFNAGSTGFELSDLFLNNGETLNSKIRRLLGTINKDDYINVNARIDILNGGYRYNDRTYFSFGFYEEVDVTAYVPKDIADLIFFGNRPLRNRAISLAELTAKAEVLGVLHFGISKKVDEKLNIGGRVKVYSSSLNIQTNHNAGTFTSTLNDTNILRQTINSADVQIFTSGLIGPNNSAFEKTSDLLSNTFLGGNLGIGLDFGVTYHLSPQLELTASILDFGFIRHSKNVRNYKAEGDFTFDGINFEFDPDNPRDYWQELEDDFDDSVPSEENQEAYTSWRPTKINAALKYSFGELRRKQCFTATRKKYYYNSIGFQIHTVMRPRSPQLSFTSFFETSISENWRTKFTYTINDFSASLIGSGLTFQWGNVNVFGLVDNILGVSDIATASNISVNFGVNFVIN